MYVSLFFFLFISWLKSWTIFRDIQGCQPWFLAKGWQCKGAVQYIHLFWNPGAHTFFSALCSIWVKLGRLYRAVNCGFWPRVDGVKVQCNIYVCFRIRALIYFLVPFAPFEWGWWGPGENHFSSCDATTDRINIHWFKVHFPTFSCAKFLINFYWSPLHAKHTLEGCNGKAQSWAW